MASLITLVLVTLILFAAGAAGVRRLRPWPVAVRGGRAAMFILTGVSHFVGMREDLINMVPPALPEPALLVTITGILELAGAAGLLSRRTAPWAAAGLSALLIGMFPANLYAAVEGLTLGGAPAMALIPRTLMQVLFLAITLSVVGHHLRERRRVMKVSDNTLTTTRPGQPPSPNGDECGYAEGGPLAEPGGAAAAASIAERPHPCPWGRPCSTGCEQVSSSGTNRGNSCLGLTDATTDLVPSDRQLSGAAGPETQRVVGSIAERMVL